MKQLRLHTVVFGDHYLDCLTRGLVPSLCWFKNKLELEHSKSRWSIYVKQSDAVKILDLCTKVMPVEQIDIVTSVPERMRFESQDRGTFLMDCLNETIKKCLEENRSMLMVLPDFILGDGSIGALREWSYKDNCVLTPHARVLPGILNKITTVAPANTELVTLAWNHLHRSWTDCEVGPFQLGSYIGGLSWRHMPDNIIAVQHRIPSVALANFTKEDQDFFSRWSADGKPPSFGKYDWSWPSECLINQERQRTITSSDIAFWIEVTAPEQNCPTRQSSDPDEPDKFFLDNLHTRMNRMIISSFRHDGKIK